MNTAVAYLWEITCLVLFLSVFARAVAIGPDAPRDLRLALLLCGMSSLMGLVAPLYGWAPDIIDVMVLGGAVVFQLVATSYWAHFMAAVHDCHGKKDIIP